MPRRPHQGIPKIISSALECVLHLRVVTCIRKMWSELAWGTHHGAVLLASLATVLFFLLSPSFVQVDETVEGIKAVPRNAQAAAKQKADELAAGMRSVPDKIVEAAKVRCRDLTRTGL